MNKLGHARLGGDFLTQLRPDWRICVPSCKLSISLFDEESDNNLLKLALGSFTDGANLVTGKSGRTLIELGFVPSLSKGVTGYNDAAVELLRQWHAVITGVSLVKQVA